MQNLPLKDLIPQTVDAYGALDFDARARGIGPRRLPAWTRRQIPDLMSVMVRMPSGVRLAFRSDSTKIGLTFLATNLVTPPRERRPISFNLEIGSQLLSANSTQGNTIFVNPDDPTDFRLERGEPDTVTFTGLAGVEKGCELWLPHNAYVELRDLHLEDGALLEAPRAESTPRWVHYGSSISHCMEADEPALIWPAVAARRAGAALQNLGFGGQCHLDQFVARTIRDLPADIISVKAGINVVNMDSMRERVFAPALHGFLDTIREGKPDHPLVLISPIFCPCAEDHPGPTVPDAQGRFVVIPGARKIRDGCLSLRRIREIMAEVVAKRRSAGDGALHYLDGLELFGEDDAGDLPDDLHPNPAGYVRMGDRFSAKILDELCRAARTQR